MGITKCASVFVFFIVLGPYIVHILRMTCYCFVIRNSRNSKKIQKKQEALKALETLHKFFECAAVDQTIFDKIYELEKHAQNVNTESQNKLTDFFK